MEIMGGMFGLLLCFSCQDLVMSYQYSVKIFQLSATSYSFYRLCVLPRFADQREFAASFQSSQWIPFYNRMEAKHPGE
jgi:hypothetical protein